MNCFTNKLRQKTLNINAIEMLAQHCIKFITALVVNAYREPGW
jgi:hypothetical protein